MRLVAVLGSVVLGCGRVGFELCAGCTTPSGVIERKQVVAPGAMSQEALALTIDGTAEDLALLAVYSHAPSDRASVADSAGEAWSTLPLEVSACGDFSGLRFWYAVLGHDGAHTITIRDNIGGAIQFGAFAIVYTGVDSTSPIDAASGQVASGTAHDLAAGSIEATDDAMIVAAFADVTFGPGTMPPGVGYRMLAHDDAYAALIEDQWVGPGSYTPSASLPGTNTSGCWIGASVALRAN